MTSKITNSQDEALGKLDCYLLTIEPDKEGILEGNNGAGGRTPSFETT